MTRGTLRRLGHALLHTGDSPERTALAFSIGILIGFSPLLGLHTLISILVAFVFRFNRLAILAGTYSNLPWFMGPYYALSTGAGAILLRTPLPPDLAARIDAVMARPGWGAQLEGLATLLRPFLWPYIVGSSLGCMLLAAVAYRPTLEFIRRRRLKH